MAIREIVATSPFRLSLGQPGSVGVLAALLERQLAEPLRSLSITADWIEHRHRHVTAAYSVDNETVILANATGGAFSVTLPPSNPDTINRCITVKRLNAGVNAVTIAAQGTDLIDGAATQALALQYAALTVLSDGLGAWHVI